MRSKSRYFDENESAIPWDYIEFMHTAMKAIGGGVLLPKTKSPTAMMAVNRRRRVRRSAINCLATQIEMLAWGDVGMYLITPGGGLGAAAVQAAASPEQKAKFLARFGGEKPTFASMSMTEPGAGSDTSAIRTRAVLDEQTNEWVLNGEKIFVTAGDKSLTAVRETRQRICRGLGIDRSASRAAAACAVSWSRAGRPACASSSWNIRWASA